MLPQNVLSVPPIYAPFLTPKDQTKLAMADTFPGGIAIGDASGGLNSQAWRATVPDVARLQIWYTSASLVATQILVAPQKIVWVAACFDQGMRPMVTWTDITGATYFYWYDSTIPGYRTDTLAAGIVNAFATLDDARSQENSTNDTILSYIKAGSLYYRQQRDRFATEYLLGATPARLVQVGLNRNFRLQFQLQNIKGNADVPPAEFSGVGYG
jgi:hypothetical protein